MARIGKAEFMKLVETAGLAIGRWRPGDGVTRYRFFESMSGNVHEKFNSGDGIYTALGTYEAVAFLRGYIAGMRRRQDYSDLLADAEAAIPVHPPRSRR